MLERASNLKTTVTSSSKYWKDRSEALESAVYQARCGRRWKEELKLKLGKGVNSERCVVDLMDHAIREGNHLCRNTIYLLTWVIYHDALSACWIKGAQEYMWSRHFENRQIRRLGLTNNGTRQVTLSITFTLHSYSALILLSVTH